MRSRHKSSEAKQIITMMSRLEYENTASEAALAFHRRQHRLSATKYLEAFLGCPDRWDYNRWQVFHGYSSILQEEYFQASLEADIIPLKAIVNDKKELKLYRIEAAFTTGILLWLRGKREEAADYYREAIDLAEKVPKQEKRHKVVASQESPDGTHVIGLALQPMEDLIPGIVKVCKSNIQRMDASMAQHMPPPEQRFRSDGTPMPRTPRFTGIPVGPMVGDEGILTAEEVDQLLKVGGERCDCCGKSREELGRKLLDVCSIYKKGYYCGRECQTKQWKAGHKKWCRKPGELKAGDYVRLQGLQAKPELNGTLVKVVGEDSNNKGRWEVKVQGGTKTISVAAEKMEQLRPLK